VTGTGPSAAVVADQGGVYSCTFTTSANRDCAPDPFVLDPSSADPCQPPGSGDCPVSVEVKEITFTSDHSMYEGAAPYDQQTPPQGWGAGGALSGVDWRSEDNPDHPVCYTRSTPLNMTVTFEVKASGGGTATLRVVGEDGMSGTRDFTVPCGTELQTLDITTSNIPSVVEAYEPMMLIWYVKPSGETEYTSIGTTQHSTYVTYGIPIGGSPTKERMNFLCNEASGQSTQIDVTDEIHAALNADPPNDPPDHDPPLLLTDDWPIMCPARLPTGEIYVGYCDHQALFMLRGMRLMGIAGSAYNTFASSDTTVHIPESKVQDNKTWWLKFDFDDNGEVDNNYEGSVIAVPRYYTVWPSLTADSECLLLWQVGPDGYGATQRWVQTLHGDFGDPVIGEPLPVCQDYPSCP